MRFAGKTVVVTGAGGFIGSHVVERLVREGATVRAVLRYTSRGQRGALDLLPADVMEAVELTLGDVRDFDAVREVMRGADAMLHLAALVGIPYSYEHPQEVIDTNVVGTSNVLLAAKELGSLERVVLTSTSEVYGSALRVPMDEEHPLQAQSPYSATKIAGDALGQSFQRSFGLPVTIVRPFNAYGPRQSARAVIPTIIAQAVSGSALKLGSVATTRDFTFVEDTAQAFLQIGAAEAALGEVVNAGSGREIAISDVVEKVAEITGRELDVETDAQRVRPEASEVSRLLSDSSKAERLAGWRAETSLDDGLRRTVDWIREHIDLYRPDEYAV
ncbi:MAG TPA: SDR family NAD(P)-dependent oxidoreductase [Acidimicrobiia bacterium]|nr:SDR family NAD(P)-dependent oxidoreductase [Acidimicrobiia bacterium]